LKSLLTKEQCQTYVDEYQKFMAMRDLEPMEAFPMPWADFVSSLPEAVQARLLTPDMNSQEIADGYQAVNVLLIIFSRHLLDLSCKQIYSQRGATLRNKYFKHSDGLELYLVRHGIPQDAQLTTVETMNHLIQLWNENREPKKKLH
jgi:hypothetical protein